MPRKLITLHHEAPDKPLYGAKCNGCGICCAAEPCPVAHLLLWQFRGACRALQWDETRLRYLCGMVIEPKKYLRFLPDRLSPWMGKWCASRIAADIGCDSRAEIDP